jgi:hypothetical protein
LTPEELTDRARNQRLFYEGSVFKDSTGRIVSTEDFLALYHHTHTTDYYADTAGIVRERVIRRVTRGDVALWLKMKQALDEGPIFTLLPIDCSTIKDMLQQVYEKDQGNRKNYAVQDPKIDHENQQKVISIIEKCGFPSAEQAGLSGVNTVFLIIQHASLKQQEKYFTYIQQSAARGDIGWSAVAMMEDRILMGKGRKQKYGSQVTKVGDGPWQLYPVEDPMHVNQRRAQAGLGPIEEYLANFDIVFSLQE